MKKKNKLSSTKKINIKSKTNKNYNQYVIKYWSLIVFTIITLLFVYFWKWWKENLYLMVATLFAVYMLFNIWASDVANNMWPAVWSKALTLWKALLIAAIFEAAWAIIAWWNVTDTIKWWIIDVNTIWAWKEFIVIMLSTLLWAAIWINIATYLKAPVSTTNSVVWGLLWAWIWAAWISVVKWAKVWEIALSWVISVLLWWIICVLIYHSIRKFILKKEHKGYAAKYWVPIYVWVIWWVFSLYLLMKWLKPLLNSNELLSNTITPSFSIILSLIIWFWSFGIVKYRFSRYKKSFFENDKKFVNKLFNAPLIVAVSLLCFAHGSNDVSNAVWPLAAIYDTVVATWDSLVEATWVPIWIMILWGLWLSAWLATFWARLIKTVWSDITKIDQVRAFSISMATATTVLLASALWLPVSSTQITLWSIFWIWLFRKYLSIKRWQKKEVINIWMMKWIMLSWVITLPATWLISAITYFVIIRF